MAARYAAASKSTGGIVGCRKAKAAPTCPPVAHTLRSRNCRRATSRYCLEHDAYFSRGIGGIDRKAWAASLSARKRYRRQGRWRWGLWSKPANGAGADDRLLEIGNVGGAPAPSSWSHDGKFLLFHYLSGGGGLDIFKLPLDTRKPERLLRTTFSERFASLSPDDRWVAYISNETGGRDEVFVRPMATEKGAATGGRWQVSKDGVVEGPIAWKFDGTELVFRDMTSTLISVPLEVSGDVLKPGLPQRLFTVSTGAPWTMSKDGKRFLVAVPQALTQQSPIIVVLNWDSLLTK